MLGNPTLFHQSNPFRKMLTQLRNDFSVKQNLLKNILREYKT